MSEFTDIPFAGPELPVEGLTPYVPPEVAQGTDAEATEARGSSSGGADSNGQGEYSITVPSPGVLRSLGYTGD